MLVHRDELVGLLKSLDKEGQEGARTFYLEAWNGTGSYTFDRIGRGTLEIPAAILSMMGGVQPGPLGQYLRAASREGKGDDGLVQRLQLAVWPDVDQDWVNVDREPDPVARDKAYAVYAGLDGLDATLVCTVNVFVRPGSSLQPHVKQRGYAAVLTFFSSRFKR